MSSSARLKYKIVKCTSEDPEYPVSELLAHSSQTKGWQTARFCEFPQEIGLQFETPVHLRQVQFLSHQSKIATKIELFTALPANGENGRYETAQFKRLGYLSLDNNERSQFQARELKSVYVDVSAQFVRVLLHKCHVNRYNIVNQVGLIALHCSGEVLGPDLAVGPPPPNPMLARGGLPDAQSQRAPAPMAGPSQELAHEAAKDAAQAAADEMRFDARTLERLRSITAAKQRAVEAEDYEEAKRCKEMLARLRQTGQLLRDLEDRKRTAVQNEDYDAAKALKVEIDRLRMSIDAPPQNNARAAPMEQPVVPDGRNSPEWAPPQATAPRGAHQPVMAQGPGANGGYDRDGPSGDQRGSSQGRVGSASLESPLGTPYGGRGGGFPGDSMFGADDGSGVPGGGRSGSGPTLNSSYDGPAAFDPSFDPSGGVEGSSDGPQSQGRAQSPPLTAGGMGGFGSSQQQALEPERSTPNEATHHLRGVPNVEDLNSPEALGATLDGDKDVQLMVQLFGDYITRCIFSKTWNLRDAALQKLALDLRGGARAGDAPEQLLQAYAAILKRTIPDKNVQVLLRSGSLLQEVAHVLLENDALQRHEVQRTLDPLMPLLVEHLGNSNARIDKTARDGLLELGRRRNVGAHFAAQFLLKSPKKKTVLARVFSSRLQVLTALAAEFGVQPESRDGVPLEATVNLAMESFNNKDGEVREHSVKLVGACYVHVGLERIEEHLANLRPAQREVFDAEFDRVSGGQGQPSARSARSAARDDGLPPAAVPPPRRSAAAGAAASSSNSYQQEEGSPGSLEEQEPPEFTCQFCWRQDPSFTPEVLDVHYWRECPMLIQCEFCQQVIEISTLRGHLCDECESGPQAQEKGRDMSPHQCPICRADVGNSEDQDWINHLITVGCPENPRNSAKR